MKEDMFRKFGKPRSSGTLKQALFSGAIAILCWIGFAILWKWALFFTVISAVNFWIYFRQKAKEDEYNQRMDKLEEEFAEDDDDTEEPQSVSIGHFTVKEKNKKGFGSKERARKAEYNKFLDNLENELGNFDYDYEDDEDEDEE
jgi:hypothetical protein